MAAYGSEAGCRNCVVYFFLYMWVYSSHAQVPPYTVYVDSLHGVSNTTCCQPDIVPCQTLALALECVLEIAPSTAVSVIANEGVYNLTHNASLTVFRERIGGIRIAGNCSSNACVEIVCEENAGLTFIESYNVVLENLVFFGCGFPNNSTSKDFSYHKSDPDFLEIKSALYFLLCRNVTLSEVTVEHTDGTGMVMYSTVGIVNITKSKFLNNRPCKNSSNPFTGGGGLYIEFAFCYPGNTTCFNGTSNIPKEYTSGSIYTISETTFAENLANISNAPEFTFILPQKYNHLAFGRGGGLSVFFKGNSSDNAINVCGCSFINNIAIWGGGLFVEHHDWSTNNTVLVSNSHFTENECLYKRSNIQGTGGGGVRAGYIFFGDTHATQNLIHFENCWFSNNSAFFGGGVSFYAARELTESNPTNSLVFVNTTWLNNIARAGSAIDLSVWHSVTKGAHTAANFTDCTFGFNIGQYTSELSTVVGIGALYTDSIPIYIMGDNLFEKNSHSALAALSTGIYVTSNSSLRFINNTGRYGAAISLMGNAFIVTFPEANLSFIDNSADIAGGAILQRSAGEHDLINSRNCFIRYSDIEVTPDQWTSSFFFSGNRANGHNESIYATSLLICQWGGAFGNSSANVSMVFCWSDRWVYKSGDCKEEVRTSPAAFVQKKSYLNFHIIPGQRRMMPLTMRDDHYSDVTSSSILRASVLSGDIYLESGSEYTADNRIQIHVDRNGRSNSGEIHLETDSQRVIQTKLNITVLSCPPGMVLQGGERTASCQCGGHFDGILQCNATGFETKIQRGNWIGTYTYNHQKMMVASGTPYFYSFSKELFFPLPHNINNLDQHLCHKINREGTLCGRCRKGYGPALKSLSCIKCDSNDTKYTWIYYLLLQYVPLTIFFIIVVVMDIKATSGPTNAFIFFAQVVPVSFTLNGGGAIYVWLRGADDILPEIYTLLYNVWNLRFFDVVQQKFCLSPYLSTLQVLSIAYLEALYPLVLICLVSVTVWLYDKGVRPIMFLCQPIYKLLAKFQRKFHIERSLEHAFASFILLSYSRFILISFFLMTKTTLTKDDGGTFGPQVLYYDGTVVFLSSEHAPYFVLSLFVLMTFVAIPPILLCLPSLDRKLNILNKIHCTRHGFFNNFAGKYKIFLRAFYGCYKDGTGSAKEYDCRWFASFYLVLRVVIFAIYAFTTEWFTQYTCIQFLCIVGILAFLILQPYENNFYNKLDASMFCLLVAINTLTMYNYFNTAIGHPPSVVVFCFRYVMVFIPLIYAALAILVYLYKKFCKGRKCGNFLRNKGRERLVDHENNEFEDSRSAFLTHVQQTGRIHDTNTYIPNMHSSGVDKMAKSVHVKSKSNTPVRPVQQNNAMPAFASLTPNSVYYSSQSPAGNSPRSTELPLLEVKNEDHTSTETQRSSGSNYGSIQSE